MELTDYCEFSLCVKGFNSCDKDLFSVIKNCLEVIILYFFNIFYSMCDKKLGSCVLDLYACEKTIISIVSVLSRL